MDKARNVPATPDIFLFYDYRAFLKSLFEFNKGQSRRFSHRYIVTRAGFKSPNVLKNVIDGKRNLTFAAAESFAKAFKLDGNSKRYFLSLVQYNQAGTPTEKEKFFQELVDLRDRVNPARLDERHYNVFSHWWHLAIREVVSLPDFQFSPDWVADALSPSITSAEAAESLSLLKTLGLIAQQKDRSWIQAEKTLATDARVKSVMVSQFHREMIRLGGESLSRFPGKEREISGTTLRVSEPDLEKIKAWLREFRMKILGLAAQSAGADQVYQLNFQFFPLVKNKRSNGSKPAETRSGAGF
ncbi:MAG TPA: TIGR02147 family protein [Fibrobacteria bacterium]|nr:TIGR02147 family protein [Fibrobacteria bacterium]